MGRFDVLLGSLCRASRVAYGDAHRCQYWRTGANLSSSTEIKRVDGVWPFCFDFHTGDPLGEYRVRGVRRRCACKTTLRLDVQLHHPRIRRRALLNPANLRFSGALRAAADRLGC